MVSKAYYILLKTKLRLLIQNLVFIWSVNPLEVVSLYDEFSSITQTASSPRGIMCSVASSPWFLETEAIPTSRSVALVNNSTGIRVRLEDMLNKFDDMYSRRAFMYWMVGEGLLESEQTSDWREELISLKIDYEEIEDDYHRARVYMR